MTGIRTGIGLFSGIDIGGLTEQLIEAQRAPARRLESRVASFQAVDFGLQALEANVLTLSTLVSTLGEKSTFDSLSVSNSSPSQLSVATTPSAAIGNYAQHGFELGGTGSRRVGEPEAHADSALAQALLDPAFHPVDLVERCGLGNCSVTR